MIKSIKNFFSEEYAIYKLSYRTPRRNGSCKVHIITKPADIIMFEGKKIGFRAYSFGRGIRKFLDFRVVSMERTYSLPNVEARPLSEFNERAEYLSAKTIKRINEHWLTTSTSEAKNDLTAAQIPTKINL